MFGKRPSPESVVRELSSNFNHSKDSRPMKASSLTNRKVSTKWSWSVAAHCSCYQVFSVPIFSFPGINGCYAKSLVAGSRKIFVPQFSMINNLEHRTSATECRYKTIAELSQQLLETSNQNRAKRHAKKKLRSKKEFIVCIFQDGKVVTCWVKSWRRM